MAADEAQAGKTHQGWLQGKFSHRSSHSPACCLHTSVAQCGIRQVSPNALTPRAASTHSPCSSPKGDSLPPPSALAGSQDPKPQQLSELHRMQPHNTTSQPTASPPIALGDIPHHPQHLQQPHREGTVPTHPHWSLTSLLPILPTLPPLSLPFSAACTTGACALNLSARIRVRSRSPLPSTEPVGAARPRLPRQVMGDGVRQGWHSTAEGWVATARMERIPPSLPMELGLSERQRWDGKGEGVQEERGFLAIRGWRWLPQLQECGPFRFTEVFLHGITNKCQ